MALQSVSEHCYEISHQRMIKLSYRIKEETASSGGQPMFLPMHFTSFMQLPVTNREGMFTCSPKIGFSS